MIFDDKHPYFHASGIPKTKMSVVVFADMLGFKDEMKKAYEEGRANAFLIKLRLALDESYKLLKYESRLSHGFTKEYATKTFTDNIVIGFPIEMDAESEMGSAFFHLCSMQIEMIKYGFLYVEL